MNSIDRFETWQYHDIAHEALDKTSVAGYTRADTADRLSGGLINDVDVKSHCQGLTGVPLKARWKM